MQYLQMNALPRIFLIASAIVASQAIQGNQTKVNKNVYLDAVEHQGWLHDLGRRGCHLANQVRGQYGKRQLYYSASLTVLGARHSNWMASYNIFEHQNLNGLGVWVGQNWLGVTAENIAMSTPRSSDPSWDAHQQWYHSPGHFRNMISPSHSHCGVGIAYDGSGKWWGTQLFGYNPHFGDEGGSAAAPQAQQTPEPRRVPVSAPAPAPAQPSAPAPAPQSVATPGPGKGINPTAGSGIQNSMPSDSVDVGGINPQLSGISVPSL